MKKIRPVNTTGLTEKHFLKTRNNRNQSLAERKAAERHFDYLVRAKLRKIN